MIQRVFKWWPLLIGAVVIFIYWPRGPLEFLFIDDEANVVLNPARQGLGLFEIWFKPYMALFIPVTYSIWGLFSRFLELFFDPQWATHGWAAPFRGLNVFVHLMNLFLFYQLLRRRWGFDFAKTENAAGLMALAIFALHPVQVESVAWISGFKELIWVTFALATMLAQTLRRPGAMWALFLAAVLCKPTAVVLPLIMGEGAMFGLGVGVAVLTMTLQSGAYAPAPVDLWARPLIFFDTIGFYVEKIFYPIALAPDYGRYPQFVLAQRVTGEMVIGGVVLLAALGLIFRRQKMSWSAREAMALFFLPLVPVSGLFAFSFQNHSTVADRYMYMPLIGLSLGLALVVRLGARSLLYIMTVAILTGAVAIFLAASSYHQADHWATNAQLLAQMQAVNPKSYMAENNLGVLAASANRPDEALKHFQRAQALNPNLSEVSTNIGAALERMGDLEGAAKQFEKVVAQDEAVFAAQAGLGAVLLKLHRESEARAHLERAIQLNAFNADALNNYAVALSLTGDRSRAVQFFEKAVERDPHNETFRRNFEAAKSAR